MAPCPICNMELSNMDENERTYHVNSCLDGGGGGGGGGGGTSNTTTPIAAALLSNPVSTMTNVRACNSCDIELECVPCFRCEELHCCYDCMNITGMMNQCQICSDAVCYNCDYACTKPDCNCRHIIECSTPACAIQLCVDCQVHHRSECKEQPKINKRKKYKPNQKCPCGSGKKYKKCCK